MKRHWHLTNDPADTSARGSGLQTRKVAETMVKALRRQVRGGRPIYIESCRETCRLASENNRAS